MMYRWMKVFKDINFYNVYLLLVSLLIVFLHVYLRLFLVRKQYNLQELKFNINYIYMILCISFILLHMAIIFFVIYKIYCKYKTRPKKIYRVFVVFSEIINKLYWRPLQYLHDVVAPGLPYSGELMLKYLNYFGQDSFVPIKSIAIFFVYIPRLLVVLSFTIELLFYNNILHYFLRLLPLLLLPNIYYVFLKFCASFSERNLPIVEEDLIVTPKGSPGANGIQTRFTFTLNPQIITNDPKFDSYRYFQELKYYWLCFYELRIVTAETKLFLGKYDPYVTLFCSLLYFLMGSYKLWYVLF